MKCSNDIAVAEEGRVAFLRHWRSCLNQMRSVASHAKDGKANEPEYGTTTVVESICFDGGENSINNRCGIILLVWEIQRPTLLCKMGKKHRVSITLELASFMV